MALFRTLGEVEENIVAQVLQTGASGLLLIGQQVAAGDGMSCVSSNSLPSNSPPTVATATFGPDVPRSIARMNFSPDEIRPPHDICNFFSAYRRFSGIFFAGKTG